MRFLLLLLFISIQLPGQNQLDDLLKSINGLPDPAKIDRLTDFCWQNRSKIPNLALKSGEEAYKIAIEISDFKRQAEALNKMGVVHRNLNNYDKAFELYNEARRISETIGDSIQIAFSLNNIGGIYRIQGNYNEALYYILRALEIFERRNFLEGMSFCTVNIGLIYRRQNLTEKALEYLYKTLKIREQTKDYAGKALALNLIAEVYFEIGRIEEAYKFYLEVEKEYQQLDDPKGISAAWIGLAQVYINNGELKKAAELALKANELSRKISFFEGIAYSFVRLSEIYSSLGQFEKARTALNEANKISSNSKEVQIKLETLKSFTKYFKFVGDYKSALETNQKYHSLRDSILSYESVTLISQMDKDFKKERDEKIRYLTAEKELITKRRNYLIALLVMVLLISGLTYNRYRESKKYSKKLTELNSMKDTLFSIIAHDLKSPLHSMFGITDHLITEYKNIADETKINMLGKIDFTGKRILKLLENLLFWASSQSGAVKFSPAKHKIKNLVDESISLLHESAVKKRISLLNNITHDADIFCDADMIKTVIRNLLTNAIKFTNDGGKVELLLEEKKKTWKILVTDNGIGMNGEKVNSLFTINKINSTRGTNDEYGTGLGLLLCKEFIDKHDGRIEVESNLGAGTTFSVFLNK